MRLSLSFLHVTSILLALVLLTACSKSSTTKVTATYEKLGDTKINNITGFALNGDPICRGATGDVLRWRAASKDWGRISNTSGVPANYYMDARCEDAQGNFYGIVVNNGNYVFLSGAAQWTKLILPDADTIGETGQELYDNAPFANNNGEVVIQTHRIKNGIAHIRIYRKAATASTFSLASDRAQDNAKIVSLADNGDVFFQSNPASDGPKVLKAGSSTLVQVSDCGGSTVLNYCGFEFGVNPSGGIIFHQGGLGLRDMYLLNPGVTYPAVAAKVYDLPLNTCCFNGGFAYLADGTVVGRANQGGYDEYFLYIRRQGASGWYQAPSLPSDGGTDVYIKASRKGQLYTASRDPYTANSTGPLYLVHY